MHRYKNYFGKFVAGIFVAVFFFIHFKTATDVPANFRDNLFLNYNFTKNLLTPASHV